ncbi:MAG TPA: winged helix DNA-binding domain-containing protein [Kineosporiaceae bacterium]
MRAQSSTPRRIDVAERRARLGRRHRLALPAPGPTEVARALVALHGTDPTTSYLSVWARTPQGDGDVAAVERALYEERSLLRLLAMRRTVFAVTRDSAPVVLAACSREVAGRERRKLVGWLTDTGVAADPDGWLATVEQVALEALAGLGEATAAQLGECDPRLRTEITLGRGTANEGSARLASRVLLVLAAQGRVVRGRPLGSWTSTQFTWTTAGAWFDGGLPEVDVPEAEAELVRAWLTAFGPATVDDLRWWTGWTQTRTRTALARVATASVDLDGVPALVLADDVEVEPEPEPWVALLPALDPTTMGWAAREFYLGAHAPALFDRTGNASATVWVDGRVVGGWAQRADGEVVVRLLEDVGHDAVRSVEKRAAELTTHLGPVRLSARGRTMSPLEKELRGG